MNHRINQFIALSRESGLRDAVITTTSFIANKVSRKIIGNPQDNQVSVPLADKKVLFIEAVGKTDGWGIGDGILRSPLVDWLAEQSDLHVMTRTHRSTLFDNHPQIAGVFSLGEERTIFSLIRLAGRMRREEFDYPVTLNPSWKTLLFICLVKSKLMKIHSSNFSGDEIKRENATKLSLSKVRKSLGYTDIDVIPSPTLHISPEGGEHLEKYFAPERKYIGVNIGASSGLRHFHEWGKVFERLKKNDELPEDITFVLVGKDGVNNVDQSIMSILGEKNVLNFCGTLTLADTYRVISYCNTGFIGMDGGNVNAAIALRYRTHARVVPIYNVVNPDLRIPSDFPLSDCAVIPCPEIQNCFTHNGALYCTITGQLSTNNKDTPPCLQGETSSAIVYDALKALIEGKPRIS